MHRTAAGDRRQSLQKEARDARALQKAAHAPAARHGARAARRGGSGPGRGPGPQAPGQAGGSLHVGDGKSQAEPQGLEDLHLLDGLLARGRQDAGVAGSCRRMDAAEARRKARKMKAEALGYRENGD